MNQRRIAIVYGTLSILLGIGALLCLGIGSVPLSLEEMAGALGGKAGYETQRIILLSVRLPRVLCALVAGAGLSLSGVLLQSVMGNALASPNTIGVNAGAGLAVILGLALVPSFGIWLPLVAFVGAFFTAMLIIALSRKAGGGRGTVILAGIACTTLFQAIISFVAGIDSDILVQYNGFAIGSFVGVETERILLPALLVALCFVTALVYGGRIAALSLGDEMATALGVRVGRIRTLALLLAAMCAAAVVSFAGLLGFVGLVIPHITRRLVGHRLRSNLIAAPLAGGILTLLSDLLGRVLFAPSEVSVGIVLALIGAPFFAFLLLKKGGGENA